MLEFLSNSRGHFMGGTLQLWMHDFNAPGIYSSGRDCAERPDCGGHLCGGMGASGSERKLREAGSFFDSHWIVLQNATVFIYLWEVGAFCAELRL